MNDSAIPIGTQPLRLGLAMATFIGLFVLIGYRLHFLQVDEGARMAQLGERQRARTWTIPAPRGGFYDCSGSPLVVSNGTWTVVADPVYMDDRLRATVELDRLLGLGRDELRRQFESQRNGRILARGVDDERAEQVRDLKLTGINLRREFSRRYPEGPLVAQVVGVVLDSGKGGAGLELELEEKLAGLPGRETVSVDALGRPSLSESEQLPARPGAQVQLTLDLRIQRELDQALREEVEKCKPVSASGLVLRPTTGEVLAMVSWPTFDPQDLSKLDPVALRNNAIAFVYEPGSTFKPLVAGAAVADHLAAFGETIDCCRGAWTYRAGRAVRTIHEKTGGHGPLTVTQGIALSDNILMAKLGVRFAPERLKDWINRFGFGQRTGLPLPGEEVGQVPHGRWSAINEGMSIPIGHNLSVTPIQLASAHAAIANHGLWLPPRLIKRIFTNDNHGNPNDLPLPALPEARRIFTAEDAAGIQEAMNHTMIEGTGKRAALDGYTSAGKTGTAEKVIDGHYANDHNIGSFVCWAPAEPGVEPELLCLVVIDDPSQGGRFGAEIAAPVVQRVLQFSLEQVLKVPKRADVAQTDDAQDPSLARRRR
jgi:cell division protein FtsI/penicillin-binding protein 2